MPFTTLQVKDEASISNGVTQFTFSDRSVVRVKEITTAAPPYWSVTGDDTCDEDQSAAILRYSSLRVKRE